MPDRYCISLWPVQTIWLVLIRKHTTCCGYQRGPCEVFVQIQNAIESSEEGIHCNRLHGYLNKVLNLHKLHLKGLRGDRVTDRSAVTVSSLQDGDIFDNDRVPWNLTFLMKKKIYNRKKFFRPPQITYKRILYAENQTLERTCQRSVSSCRKPYSGGLQITFCLRRRHAT